MHQRTHRIRVPYIGKPLLGRKAAQIIATLFLAAASSITFALDAQPINQLIVKFSPETRVALNKTADDGLFRRLSMTAKTGVSLKRSMSGQQHVILIDSFVSGEDLDKIMQNLRADPGIESVEADSQILPFQLPEDSLFEDQWPLHSSAIIPAGMDLPAAWDLVENPTEVVVAVIDTGVLPDHVDLQGRILDGYDFISSFEVGDNSLLNQYPEYLSDFRSNDNDGRDPDASDPGDWVNVSDANAMQSVGVECYVQQSTFHGTAMAGIIAGQSLHSHGITGVNWNAKILPARVSGKCGGSRSDMIDAIRWAAGIEDSALPYNPNPAKIINLSLGSNASCGFAEQAAIDEAWDAGVIVVAAAGNSAQNFDEIPTSPASCNNVISVSAVRQDGHRAFYSNYGIGIDIAAPGGEGDNGDGKPMIVATNYGEQSPLHGSHYKHVTGTSGAAAHVSGVLSLMLSAAPNLSNEQLTDYLLQSSNSFRQGGYPECDKNTCGAGTVNALSAVQAAISRGNDDNLNIGNALPSQSGVVITGASGGGCTIASDSRSFDPTFLLLLSLLFLRRRRIF